jgi:hypothetical protein
MGTVKLVIEALLVGGPRWVYDPTIERWHHHLILGHCGLRKAGWKKLFSTCMISNFAYAANRRSRCQAFVGKFPRLKERSAVIRD